MSTTDIEIEPAIPMPKPRKNKKRLLPIFAKMQPGESVLVDVVTANCLTAFLRRRNQLPITRQEGPLVRVWRGK